MKTEIYLCDLCHSETKPSTARYQYQTEDGTFHCCTKHKALVHKAGYKTRPLTSQQPNDL